MHQNRASMEQETGLSIHARDISDLLGVRLKVEIHEIHEIKSTQIYEIQCLY